MTPHVKEHRVGAGFIDEPWCQALRAAAKSMTRADLAQRAGYSKAKLQELMGGNKRPTMDELVHLAEALSLPKLRILALAGHLDRISNLLSYMDQLEEQANRVDQAAARLTLDQLTGASRIASAALTDGGFKVTLQPRWWGTDAWRRHYSDWVTLQLVADGSITAEVREHIESVLGDELAWFGAGFAGNPASGTEEPGPDFAITINIPRFVASRRGSGSPLPGLPRSIAVIGGGWSGSADVASFLGYAFDYDYSHVAFVASRVFSRLTHRWDHPYHEQDRMEIVRTYIEGSDIGRTRVWAADVGTLDTAARMIASSRRRRTPFVIYLRPSDDLIEWTAHARNRWGHTAETLIDDLQRMRSVRQRVDDVLQDVSHKSLILQASLPAAASIDRSGGVIDAPDAFFEGWAGLAEQAIWEMRRRYGFQFDAEEAHRRLRDENLQI